MAPRKEKPIVEHPLFSTASLLKLGKKIEQPVQVAMLLNIPTLTIEKNFRTPRKIDLNVVIQPEKKNESATEEQKEELPIITEKTEEERLKIELEEEKKIEENWLELTFPQRIILYWKKMREKTQPEDLLKDLTFVLQFTKQEEILEQLNEQFEAEEPGEFPGSLIDIVEQPAPPPEVKK